MTTGPAPFGGGRLPLTRRQLLANLAGGFGAVALSALLDEQAEHVGYILGELKKRELATIEPSVAAVDDYTQLIRTNPGAADLLEFFGSCTPGYFNSEGKATRSNELFGGLRYGAGPMAWFELLKDWRASGRLEDQHLFYLMARGIPADEAKRLVIRGFFGELILQIEVPELRARITAAVEAELA